MTTIDKSTIGVTAKAQKILDLIAEDKAFANQIDAAKFAMSIAIKRGVKPGEVIGAGTKWNVGSFDPNGDVRKLIQIFFPDVTSPYRALESLIDSGLDLIAKDYIKSQRFDFATVLSAVGREKKSPGKAVTPTSK